MTGYESEEDRLRARVAALEAENKRVRAAVAYLLNVCPHSEHNLTIIARLMEGKA